jgi:sugar lactone lactonase YvrE
VTPHAAIPGGEFQIRGTALTGGGLPRVSIGDARASVVIGTDHYLVARVPDGATMGSMVVDNGGARSLPWRCEVGIQVADSLHPVANPALDRFGDVFTTFSGSRGQRTAVSVYRVDANFNSKPFLADIMNATGLAFDREGLLYVSSRFDGIVYQVTPKGELSVYIEGMGVATGIAFDREENLYVGDRNGTIFKIARSRQVFVFATIEPSIAAYHLAFGPDDYLYVCGPTTSSYDSVQRISPRGDVEVFYRGLGRPQGLAFDATGNLYAAASLAGRRGVVRITTRGEAEPFVSGPNIVGLAFGSSGQLYLTTTGGLYRVNAHVRPFTLPNLS